MAPSWVWLGPTSASARPLFAKQENIMGFDFWENILGFEIQENIFRHEFQENNVGLDS